MKSYLLGASILTAMLCAGCSYSTKEQADAAIECEKAGMAIEFNKNAIGRVQGMACVKKSGA